MASFAAAYLYKRYRKDRIYRATGCGLFVIAWFPGRTSIPCVPLHSVHQTLRRAFLFARTVSCLFRKTGVYLCLKYYYYEPFAPEQLDVC